MGGKGVPREGGDILYSIYIVCVQPDSFKVPKVYYNPKHAIQVASRVVVTLSLVLGRYSNILHKTLKPLGRN